MQCPKCKHENREGALFCEKCGTKIQLVCPNCGNELRPEALFCDKCGTKVEAASTAETSIPRLEDMQKQLQNRIPQSLAEKLFAGAKQMQGEYRLVTALFADISGSSTMARNMPLEQYINTMNDCFKMMVDVISVKYEGSINRFIGDCVLAFFGAPITHENDAERAIMSALDIRDNVKSLGLSVSIGINTGTTYFGEMGSDLLYVEHSAWGPDVDFAKRLQESAEPGQVLVGSGTYRLTRREFDFDAIPNLTVKRFTQPVTAYSVNQVKAHPEKLRGIEGLRARMIGREHEFAELKEAIDEWLNGHGQIVSIIGEAGIGKSRLVTELKEYLRKDETIDSPVWEDTSSFIPHPSSFPSHPSYFLEGRCVSIGQPISYWPFLDILRTYFNLSEGDDPAAIASKVMEGAKRIFPQSADEVLPFLGNLLSIRFGNELDDRLKFATPEQIRHQTLMQLRDLFEALARQRPLLLILEDLHWADELSLNLISLLMDELTHTPLMLLCVYRPEKEHPVSHLSDQAQRKCLDRYTEITLKKLSTFESRQLVEELLTIDNLPEVVKDMILDKSEGNPFFIEEVIRSLIDRDLVYREEDRWKARDKVSGINVPDTIQSIVLSRVDKLQAEAKHVLQCASVIGRLFKYRLLEHLTRKQRELERYLAEFEERDLVYEERTVPELEYAFKHALTQEATYQGILESKRKELHCQVAKGIEQLYEGRLEEHYDELIQHYSKTDNLGKTIEYLLKAGEKARKNYVSKISISYFERALSLLKENGIDNKERKLEALRGIGENYIAIGEATKAEEAFRVAIELAKELEPPPRQLVRLYDKIGEAIYWQARYHEIIEYGKRGLEKLGHDDKCVEAVLMNTKIAVGYSNLGKEEERWQYARKNMEIIGNLPYTAELAYPYTLIMETVVWHDRGLKSATKWNKELEEKAEQHNDRSATALAWHNYGDLLKDVGDYKGSICQYSRSISVFGSIGDNRYLGWDYWEMGTLFLTLGDIDEAKKHLGKWLKITERMGNQREIGYANLHLGRVSMCQHCWEEAISYYQKSSEVYQSTNDPRFPALGNISLGNAYLKKGDYSQTLQIFHKTIDQTIVIQREGMFGFSATTVSSIFATALHGLETVYRIMEITENFTEFCLCFRKRHSNLIERLELNQWYLEPAEPCKDSFQSCIYADNFEAIHPSWIWMDEFGDCSYSIRSNGLEICAANGRDFDGLNLSAPRLMREITGDFAMEVCVLSSNEDRPHQGGLLVWKDKDNFLRFEIGTYGQGEVRLHGYVSRKSQIAGRGLLPANDETHLRLERSGDEFSAYCSIDGENWFTCGRMILPMEDPIQIGIHAIGMIDRTIYCGAYKEGTATLFREFRLWVK